MNLILFLIKKKLKSYFRADNWKSMTGDALYAVILLFYALLAGLACSEVKFDKALLLVKSISYALIVVPVFYKFFPSFSLKKMAIAPQYPLNKARKASIDLLAFSLYKTIYLLLLLFVFVFYFSAKNLAGIEFAKLLLYWLAGMLFAENLINAISWRKYGQLILLLILAGLCYFSNGLTAANILILIMINVVLIFFYYLFYQNKEIVRFKQRKKQTAIKRTYAGMIGKLLIHNKTVVIMLLMGLGIIIFFFTMFFEKVKHTSANFNLDIMLSKLPFLIIFLLPVVIFTYVFNNLWGLYANIGSNLLIIHPPFKKQKLLYLSLFFPAATLYLIVVVSILVVYKLFSWKIILYYIVFSLSATPIGIISSYLKYKKVEGFRFGQMRTTTSTLFNLLIIFFAVLLGVFYTTKYWTFAIIGMIIISVIIEYYFVFKKEKYLVRKLKSKIFNKREF